MCIIGSSCIFCFQVGLDSRLVQMSLHQTAVIVDLSAVGRQRQKTYVYTYVHRCVYISRLKMWDPVMHNWAMSSVLISEVS